MTDGGAPHGVGGKSQRGWLFLLPVIALWIIPVILFAVLVPVSGQLETESLGLAPIKLTVVGSRNNVTHQGVDVAFALPAAVTVKSNASGTVTAVKVSQGARIANGTPILSVDDVRVLAYTGAAPLFRDLGDGDHGADVQRLGSYLAALGLLSHRNVGRTFGYPMYSAVSALEKLEGATPDGHFSVSSVVYVEPGATEVGSVDVGVGDQIERGTPLFEGLGAPASVRFSLSGSDDQMPTNDGRAQVITAGAKSSQLSGLVLDKVARSDLLEFLLAGVVRGDIQKISATDGSGLTIFSGGVLSDADSQLIGTTPSSAVYVSTSGRACVFRRTAASAGVTSAYSPVRIPNPQIVNGELAVVAVPAALVGTTIVRDPLALPGKSLSRCR